MLDTYDPASPLLGIYPDKAIIHKDACSPMFTAMLFTAAKTQKETKCPLLDEWMKKMWHTYIKEQYSVITKQNNAICGNMDATRDYYTSERSQKEKDKFYMISNMWNLKYDTNEPIYDRETQSQTQRTNWWLPGGDMDRESWTGQLGLAFIYRVGTQQGPSVYHRELYSVSYDKP